MHLDETSTKTVRRIEEQIIKKHLDILILKALKNESLSGYAIICLVHREHCVLLGAGMVYNLLDSMEKRKLIKTNGNQKAKNYVLTEEGEETLNVITTNRNRIRNVTNSIF